MKTQCDHSLMPGSMLSGGGEVSSTIMDITIVWGKRASKIEVAGVASWTACATAAATLLAWSMEPLGTVLRPGFSQLTPSGYARPFPLFAVARKRRYAGLA